MNLLLFTNCKNKDICISVIEWELSLDTIPSKFYQKYIVGGGSSIFLTIQVLIILT